MKLSRGTRKRKLKPRIRVAGRTHGDPQFKWGETMAKKIKQETALVSKQAEFGQTILVMKLFRKQQLP